MTTPCRDGSQGSASVSCRGAPGLAGMQRLHQLPYHAAAPRLLPPPRGGSCLHALRPCIDRLSCVQQTRRWHATAKAEAEAVRESRAACPTALPVPELKELKTTSSWSGCAQEAAGRVAAACMACCTRLLASQLGRSSWAAVAGMQPGPDLRPQHPLHGRQPCPGPAGGQMQDAKVQACPAEAQLSEGVMCQASSAEMEGAQADKEEGRRRVWSHAATSPLAAQ